MLTHAMSIVNSIKGDYHKLVIIFSLGTRVNPSQHMK